MYHDDDDDYEFNNDEYDEWISSLKRDTRFVSSVLKQLRDIQMNTATLMKAITLLGEALDGQSRAIENLHKTIRNGMQ